MDQTKFSPRRLTRGLARVGGAGMVACLLWPGGNFSLAAPKPASVSTVPEWSRFELTLQSSVAYPNPLHEASLSAWFVSPLGETNRVDGFWDGEKTWRVRFAPDMPGRWTFTTSCSDRSNTNLDGQTGEFKCVAALAKTALDRHGPIRVARDRRHFEHGDRTPFLWLGDAVWNGARLSALEDWRLYSEERASQKFTVLQWTVAPGKDAHGEKAFTGRNPIAINAGFFQRLEEKVEAANRAGLVCAIVPLQEFGGADGGLPEDEAALLVRYTTARWGAHHVAWILAFEGDSLGKRVGRWKRIGRLAFANRAHAPVILMPGETPWLLDEFRDEAWLDAFALPKLNPDENGLQWMLSGPLSVEWKKSPPRPIVNLSAPPDTSPAGDDARRMLWWNLLMNPTAGANYTAAPVVNWDTNLVTNPNMLPRTMPAWHSALFLPGARSVTMAADFFGRVDFSQLRPAPRLMATQPGFQNPRRHVAAATSETKDLTLVYVPEDRAIELSPAALSLSPSVSWFDPRTGESKPAVAAMRGKSWQFSTPEAGDWVLVSKTEK